MERQQAPQKPSNRVERITVRMGDDTILVAEADTAQHYWNLLVGTGKVTVDRPGGSKSPPKFIKL